MARRLAGAAAALVVGLALLPGPAVAAAPLPSYLEMGDDVRQLVTVTSGRWGDTRARLSFWERERGGAWHRVRGPVRVRLGWNGWVPAAKRRQNTGTTPVGSDVAAGGPVAYKAAGTFVAFPQGTYEVNARVAGSSANAIQRTGVQLIAGKMYSISARGDMTVTSTTAATRPFLDFTANR